MFLRTYVCIALLGFVLNANGQPMPARERLADICPPDFAIGGALHGYTNPIWRVGDDYFYRAYGDIADREFNAITATAYMANAWQDPASLPDTSGLVAATKWAMVRKKKVHAHALVYPSSNTNLRWWNHLPNEEVEDTLREYVRQMVKSTKDEIWVWDVVNEPFASSDRAADANSADEDGIAKGVWTKDAAGQFRLRPYKEFAAMKQGYIEKAFRWAYEAAEIGNAKPSLKPKLILSEHGCEEIEDRNGVFNTKRDNLFKFCKKLKQQGVPIDGVGFQMHWQIDDEPNYDSIRENFRQFRDAGFLIYITEMDVVAARNAAANALPTEAELSRQTRIYENVLDLALKERACKSMLMWDFADDQSWLHPHRGKNTFPTVFWAGHEGRDPSGHFMKAKPAYYGIQRTLREDRGRFTLAATWDLNTANLARDRLSDGKGGFELRNSVSVGPYDELVTSTIMSWYLERIEGNKYRIRNSSDEHGYLLQVGDKVPETAGEYAPSPRVSVDTLKPWDSQQWVLESVGNGGFRIRNFWSGQYLTREADANGEPGKEVGMRPLNKTWAAQVWFFDRCKD